MINCRYCDEPVNNNDDIWHDKDNSPPIHKKCFFDNNKDYPVKIEWLIEVANDISEWVNHGLRVRDAGDHHGVYVESIGDKEIFLKDDKLWTMGSEIKIYFGDYEAAFAGLHLLKQFMMLNKINLKANIT